MCARAAAGRSTRNVVVNKRMAQDAGHVNVSPGTQRFSAVPCGLSLVSGLLLWLSFPPVGIPLFSWVSLGPLLWLLDQTTTKRAAFGWAYLTGFVFFLAVLQWIHFVTILGLILLALYLALYFGVFGVWYVWALQFRPAVRLFLVPAGWVVLEYVRGNFLTGFNWGSLGHSQARVSGLTAFAAAGGVAGVSFLVAHVNVLLKEIVAASVYKRPWRGYAIMAGAVSLVLSLGFAVSRFEGSVLQPGAAIRVALVQPNISLAEAWSPGLKAYTVRRQIEMSREALPERPELIIWPENSFPQFVFELPELFEEVRAFAREHKVSLLIGAVTQEKGQYFNSVLLIWPNGEVRATHSKRHLVLFGEYIPFRKELPFLSDIVPIDDFTPGREDTIFELPNGKKFAVLVCFEDTIPGLARRYVEKGADFLVNMTNDAWFQDVGQQRMHLENAIFRSVENTRPLVRATNTGESCAVRQNGDMIGCVEGPSGHRVLVEGVSVLSIIPSSGQTIYRKYGEIFTFLCFLGILGAFARSLSGRRREGIHEDVKKDSGC